MQTLMGKHWHHLPVEEVVQLLETDLEPASTPSK